MNLLIVDDEVAVRAGLIELCERSEDLRVIGEASTRGSNNLLGKDRPLIDSFIVPGDEVKTLDVYALFGRQLFLAFTARF